MQEGNELACFDLDGFSTSAGGANVERGAAPSAACRMKVLSGMPTALAACSTAASSSPRSRTDTTVDTSATALISPES